MAASFNSSITFNDADTVTVRFARPDRALVVVVGGGVTYDLAPRHGLVGRLTEGGGLSFVQIMLEEVPKWTT